MTSNLAQVFILADFKLNVMVSHCFPAWSHAHWYLPRGFIWDCLPTPLPTLKGCKQGKDTIQLDHWSKTSTVWESREWGELEESHWAGQQPDERISWVCGNKGWWEVDDSKGYFRVRSGNLSIWVEEVGLDLRNLSWWAPRCADSPLLTIFRLQWCKTNMYSVETKFWILIFSGASDMWYDTVSWCWAVAGSCGFPVRQGIVRVNNWYSTSFSDIVFWAHLRQAKLSYDVLKAFLI